MDSGPNLQSFERTKFKVRLNENIIHWHAHLRATEKTVTQQKENAIDPKATQKKKKIKERKKKGKRQTYF